MIHRDREPFAELLANFCTLYRRESSPDLIEQYWAELKSFHAATVAGAAAELKRSLSRFPTIADWIRACRVESARQGKSRREQTARAAEVDPPMSRWARLANRVLFACAYSDERRGFTPIADSPTDRTVLDRVLAAKREIVIEAEHAEASGDPWTLEDFIDVLQGAFGKLLVPASAARRSA